MRHERPERPEKAFFSKALKIACNVAATTVRVKTPISPVLAWAIGPVYHTCDIDGITSTIPPVNPPKKESRAAIPIGNLLGLFPIVDSIGVKVIFAEEKVFGEKNGSE